ncbi:hypothetical protein GCM10028805_46990 [Spirosoma harenae]
MKIGLLFGLLSCLIRVASTYAQGNTSTFSKQDSLSSGQTASLSMHRYRLPFLTSTNLGDTKQRYTLVAQPAKLRLGNEIVLPVGVDERTVTVLSGDRVLQLWEDYVFIPDANRIRILDENALKSERPLKVSYEKLRLSLAK